MLLEILWLNGRPREGDGHPSCGSPLPGGGSCTIAQDFYWRKSIAYAKWHMDPALGVSLPPHHRRCRPFGIWTRWRMHIHSIDADAPLTLFDENMSLRAPVRGSGRGRWRNPSQRGILEAKSHSSMPRIDYTVWWTTTGVAITLWWMSAPSRRDPLSISHPSTQFGSRAPMRKSRTWKTAGARLSWPASARCPTLPRRRLVRRCDGARGAASRRTTWRSQLSSA